MEAEQAADGVEAGSSGPRPRGDGFDDVFGSAIAKAVRRAVDTVGRDPVADLTGPTGQPAPPAAAATEPDEASPPLPPTGTVDPYELLGVSRRAPWADITAAYKRRARAWHPDGAPAEEQVYREELIRALNAAYTDLRVRRGR